MTTPQTNGEWQSKNGESQPPERPLDPRDHYHSVNAGMNDFASAVKNHPCLSGFQRNHIEHRIVNPVAVAKEVIHREDDEERLE